MEGISQGRVHWGPVDQVSSINSGVWLGWAGESGLALPSPCLVVRASVQTADGESRILLRGLVAIDPCVFISLGLPDNISHSPTRPKYWCKEMFKILGLVWWKCNRFAPHTYCQLSFHFLLWNYIFFFCHSHKWNSFYLLYLLYLCSKFYYLTWVNTMFNSLQNEDVQRLRGKDLNLNVIVISV